MIHTSICELLEIEYPIISAPMAGTATADLAAAVSAAGGLGMLGVPPSQSPEQLRAQIQSIRERTERPFGVGFISSFPGLERLLQVAIEERVPAISHSFTDPTPYVAMAHEAGIKVLAQVQKVSHAKRVVQAGVDVIVAQGTAAGGHTGQIGTLPLVPAVIDIAGDIPVVAAGGIADGRGVAAALMLGAEGVWMGTRFVTSQEAQAEDWKKSHAVAAGTDDTMLTKVYDHTANSPFPKDIGDRVVRNDFNARWHGQDEAIVVQREQLRKELRDADANGDANVAAIRVGSAIGLISEVEPASAIISRIMDETEAILRSRSKILLRE